MSREVHTTHDISTGDTVKTEGNQIVEVFSVRHFNDTVSVGTTRKYPILVSINEIEEVSL